MSSCNEKWVLYEDHTLKNISFLYVLYNSESMEGKTVKAAVGTSDTENLGLWFKEQVIVIISGCNVKQIRYLFISFQGKGTYFILQ